jgi:hypothetical protein
VPQLQQVTGGEHATVPVVRTDGRHGGGRRTVGVEDDERDPLARQLPSLGLRQMAEHEEHTERAACQHPVQPSLRGPVFPAQLGQDHVDIRRARHGFDAADDLHRPRDVELVEDQIDLLDAGRLPPGSPLISVPLEAGLHTRPGLGRDVGASVEDLGHRCHGDADLVGDRGDGCGSRSGDWAGTRHRNLHSRSGSFAVTVTPGRARSRPFTAVTLR